MASRKQLTQYIGAVGQWQNEGHRTDKDRQILDGQKQAAQKQHGKAKEVGKGLRLKYFFGGNGDQL